MEIDFSFIQPIMTGLVMDLVMILLIPFIVMLVVVEILNSLKVPRFIRGTGASLLFLFLAYQMFMMRF